jgi:hypothetical protein
MFDAADNFLSSKVCALDRASMIAGNPATEQCFNIPNTNDSPLVSSLTGSTPPPAGSPAYVLSLGPSVGQLAFWKLHIDWTTPASSTLSTLAILPTRAYGLPCSTGSTPCVTQPGVTQLLDTLGDRLMTPFAYRNLGDHESLVVNHTVTDSTTSTAGVRWYEIRNPSTTPTIFQQGTVAPDGAYRWMGSIAMDRVGNVAVGYSVSSAALGVKPSIAVSGRLASDPAGTMPQGESTLFTGLGVQYDSTRALSRWGDYSSMTVDPVDDCTFYYTNQYQPADGIFNWSTRVGSFSFPSCLSDFTISANPATLTVPQGGSGPSTISTTQVGNAGTVSLVTAVSPSGAGVTAALSPTSVAAGGSSTLTVSASAGATPGNYTVTVTGTEGPSVHATTVSVAVPVPADFAISASPTSLPVTQGSSGTSTISTARVGSPGIVALQAAVSPSGAGVTAALIPTSVTAGLTSTLTVTATGGAPVGNYTVTVTGTEGSFTHAATVTATVSAPAPAPAPGGGGGCSTSGGATASLLPLLLLLLPRRRQAGRRREADRFIR